MIHAFAILVSLVLVAFACSPAQRAALPAPVGPTLNVIDTVGRGLASVMQWCEANDVDPSAVIRAAEHVVTGSRHVSARDYDAAVVEYGAAYAILSRGT